jgi:hypothetical protein
MTKRTESKLLSKRFFKTEKVVNVNFGYSKTWSCGLWKEPLKRSKVIEAKLSEVTPLESVKEPVHIKLLSRELNSDAKFVVIISLVGALSVDRWADWLYSA